MKILLTLGVCAICSAQQLTLSVSPKADAPSYTIWNVTACSSTGYDLATGQVYQQMVSHGVGYLNYAEATEAVNAKQARSKWNIALEVAKVLAGGAAAAVNFEVVKARPSLIKALNSADQGVSLAIPFIQTHAPNGPPAWFGNLLRDQDIVRVAAHDCRAGLVVLGGRGQAFTAEIK